jgi:amino-acid N-acetyltransferase
VPGDARLVWAVETDREEIAALLEATGLPWLGLDLARHRVLLARDGAGRIAGCVAVESHGSAALLRSLGVLPGSRGGGLGMRLTAEAIAEAQRLGADSIWLLTYDAADFFRRAGFEVAQREAAPASLHDSPQWGSVCSTATLMTRPLRND